MGVNSLPKTVTRQRHDCDLNPGPSASESSTLTTRLPSHLLIGEREVLCDERVCLSVCVCLSVHDHRAERSTRSLNDATVVWARSGFVGL